MWEDPNSALKAKNLWKIIQDSHSEAWTSVQKVFLGVPKLWETFAYFLLKLKSGYLISQYSNTKEIILFLKNHKVVVKQWSQNQDKKIIGLEKSKAIQIVHKQQ